MRWIGFAALALVAATAPRCASADGEAAAGGLTAVDGVKVGHHTLTERPTGCTVVLTERGVVGGVDVRGSAPGTRETDLLDPVNTVDTVHAVVLAGGSAFGLAAADGAVRWLEEHGFGFDVGVARVPIVPAAILFDLPVGGKPGVRPGPDCGYRAAAAASTGAIEEGSVGAGAGATVGKLGGPGSSMKGGIGTASIALPGGLTVAALVATNAVGDVIDPATGQVVAGVRSPDGGFLDARRMLRSGMPGRRAPAENTTLGVVATNAVLTKAQAQKVSQMAQDGFARAIYPSHTPFDGDTIFTLATGTHTEPVDVGIVGALAADVVVEAILRSVRAATGLPGIPSVSDLGAAGE